MNLINIYGFYKQQPEEKYSFGLEYCAYEVNLENFEKFILCDPNGNVAKDFKSETELLKYLLNNNYKQLKYSIETW